MEDVQELLKKDKAVKQRNRVKRLKRIIIIVVVTLLLMPSIICLILWFKISKVEQNVNLLFSMHRSEYQEYLSGTEDKNDIKVVEAKEQFDSEEEESIETIKSNNDLDHFTIEGRKVYLTFDDGPSSITNEVLDILKKYNVKATFFVIGKNDSSSLEIYKRIISEGHTLGMHTYSHNYDIIYNSVKQFTNDFDKLYDLLYKTTNEKPKFYRFPGGSSNTVSRLSMKKFIKVINQKDMIYFDWNVVNGDATGKEYTADEMVDIVMSDVRKFENSVVLMHDSANKQTTIAALPKIIKQLKKEKITILPINETSKPVQHINADTIK